MTLIKWYGVAVVLAVVFMFKSCNKDESEQKKAKSQDTPTETRNGYHVQVYADSTAVIFSTNPEDSVQAIFDLGNVDSIRFISPPPYKDIGYNGVYCWEYDITFYSNGDRITRRAYAKYRGITYKQVPGTTEGMGTDFFFVNFIRSSETIPYFDWACTRHKYMHKYIMRKRENGQTYLIFDYLPSSNCNIHSVIFKRLFKR